jgi:hypothetical protein
METTKICNSFNNINGAHKIIDVINQTISSSRHKNRKTSKGNQKEGIAQFLSFFKEMPNK